MHTFIAKILLFLVVVTLAVPESYAKRLGSGRSAGRQSSQVMRQRAAPPQRQPAVPPPQARQQAAPAQPNPGMAQQTLPPVNPAQPIRKQASSPWGGMLGGALLGLGLGSLISSGNRNDNASEQNAASQSAGTNADGSTAAGAGTPPASTVAPAEPAQQNRLGSVFLLGIIALLVFFLVRRARTRAQQRRY